MKKWIIYSVVFAASMATVVWANDDDDECKGLAASCAAACSQACVVACPPPMCPPDGLQVTHCRHFKLHKVGPSKGHVSARCWIMAE